MNIKFIKIKIKPLLFVLIIFTAVLSLQCLQTYFAKNSAAASFKDHIKIKHKKSRTGYYNYKYKYKNKNKAANNDSVSKLLYSSCKKSLSDVESYPSFLVKNKYYVLGFAALFGGSLLIDRSVNKYALDHQSNTGKDITDAVKPFGSLEYMVPAVSLFSIYGYFSKNKKFTDVSLTSIESLLFSGAITEALKVSVGRERPSGTDNPFKFKPFDMSNNYKSFPSGDATVAWSMLTPYAVAYHQPLLYLIPAAVDAERVYRNRHWLSDTLMGSAIGFSIGYFFAESNIKILRHVSVDTNGQTINLNYKF